MSDVVKLNMKKGGLRIKIKTEEDDYAEENHQIKEQENAQRRQLQSYYEKGYEEGQRDAVAELEKEYAARLAEKTEEFSGILQSIERNLSEYESSLDTIIIEVAMMLSEKIVRREIAREPIITGTLKESIRKVLGANEILIRLHPADYEEITRQEQSVLLEESFSKIKFETDERIEQGGCLVETEIGNVDSRISAQLAELKKQLEISTTV
ncbi:MAG: FliH/SctL family protein [Bacteroidota bacterium]